jgi:hypothetical protein
VLSAGPDGREAQQMKMVSATTWIDATPMKVWAILTDLIRYQDWNPLFPEAAGEIAVGRRIVLRTVPAGGRPMTIKPTITAAAAGTELCWTARLPGILSGEHRFALSAANGGTLVVQSETFRGALVPFSGKTLARAETSFQALNRALKARAEAP